MTRSPYLYRLNAIPFGSAGLLVGAWASGFLVSQLIPQPPNWLLWAAAAAAVVGVISKPVYRWFRDALLHHYGFKIRPVNHPTLRAVAGVDTVKLRAVPRTAADIDWFNVRVVDRATTDTDAADAVQSPVRIKQVRYKPVWHDRKRENWWGDHSQSEWLLAMRDDRGPGKPDGKGGLLVDLPDTMHVKKGQPFALEVMLESEKPYRGWLSIVSDLGEERRSFGFFPITVT